MKGAVEPIFQIFQLMRIKLELRGNTTMYLFADKKTYEAT
jgi:hypothetical protein